MRCLEKRAADRWQTADELLAQLEVLATPSGGMAPVVLPSGRETRVFDRRVFDRRVLIAAGAIVVIGAAMVPFLMRASPAYVIGATTQITHAPGLELDPALSPDGKIIAYTAGPVGHTRIYVRQISGETARPLTDSALGAPRTPRWTADGQSVTFLVGQSLYVAPALGGTPQLLIDASGYEFASPALSPDGKTIAYADQNAINVRSVAGGTARKLADAHYPNYLVWSPDGRRIAWVSDNAWFIYGRTNLGNLAPSSVWLVEAKGGAPIRVTDVDHLNTSPVWTSDGRSLLFVSGLRGGRDIYEQPLARSGQPRGAPVRLTTGINAHTISLSSDGSRLAYSVLATRSNLWWAPISATGVTPFAAAKPVTDENQTVEGMGVSPDGNWLVYDSNRSGAQHIFKIRISGGDPIQLTRDSVDDFLPAWSPDGREIAYHSWRGGNRDIYVVAADGREPRVATGYPGHEMYPVWSPDGQELLFISDRNKRWELYAIKRTAQRGWSAPRQITTHFGYNGRWSPDGQHVSFVSLLDTTLRMANSDGTGTRVLFDGHALGVVPQQVAFGHRSDVVYVHAIDRDSHHAFYEIPVRGGTPRAIFRFPDSARQPRRNEFDTDGARLFFTVATEESDIWMMELKRK